MDEFTYWFPMPNFKGKELHVTTWDFVKRESDLPHPLVVALPEKRAKQYKKNKSFSTRANFAMNNNILGRCIPPRAFYETGGMQLSSGVNDEGYVYGIMQHFIPQLGELWYEELNKTNGPSNAAFTSIQLQTGQCFEKATFLCGLVEDARVVGFNQFSKRIWGEICKEYPPFVMPNTKGRVILPTIYMGYLTNENTHNSMGIIPPGKKLYLDPDVRPVPRHFWVETKDGKSSFDTFRQEIREDETYQYLQSFFPEFQFPCATCTVKGDEIISVSEQ